LAIGVVMLLLSVTGLIDALARAVPKTVVREIQFGLGLRCPGSRQFALSQADQVGDFDQS